MNKLFRSGIACTAVIFMTLLLSCSSDSDIVNEENKKEPVVLSNITCNVKPFEDGDISRATITYDPSRGMLYAWEAGKERLSVFPATTENVGSFELTQVKNEKSAMFDGGGFTLTEGDRYYALGTSETFKDGSRHAPEGCAFPSRNNLTFTYAGQRQVANESTAHLGSYDYFIATDVCSGTDLASLNFEHLGAIIRVCVTGVEDLTEEEFKAKVFKNMEVYDSENSFRQPVRRLAMDDCLVDGVFTPKWTPTEIRTDDPRFSVALGVDSEHGISPNSNHELVVYMMLPPVNLTGKTLGFILTDDAGFKYYCNTPGKELKMGKAYRWTLTAVQNVKYNVTIKVNHLWQHGATQNVTRSTTGDPGYEDKFDMPTNIYLFLCADNKVKQIDVKTCTADNWTTEQTTEKFVSTYRYKEKPEDAEYKTGILYQPDGVTDKTSIRLYAVASTSTIDVSGITEGSTTETQLQGLLYSIDTADGANGQKCMKNLYSTPWTNNETFVGKLNDPFQDIFLYHTAAKVDLKWNSTAKMDPTADKVSVNSVKGTGLSLFKPTTNNGTGTYTVTTAITPGTMFNGRQVYYLPQFSNNQYNVTIGTKTSDVVFTDTNTDGGFTSWLRALIKQ